MICIYSNNDRHPVTKTFTTLHYTCRHFTSSHLNFTQLHFTTIHNPLISLNPNYISYRSISPHITTPSFSKSPDLLWCVPSLLFSENQGFCSGREWPGHEADDRTPSNSEIKNEWISTSTSHMPSLRAQQHFYI